jgi:hypothetical protein
MARAVATDAAGDVYVVGYSGALSIDFRPGLGDAGAPLKLDNPSQGPLVQKSVFVAKVAVAGLPAPSVQWAKMFGSATGGDAGTDGKTIAVVADPSNAGKEQVVIAGSFLGTVDFKVGAPLTASAALRGFVLALDPTTGGTSWVREVHGANDEGTSVTELATSANGHVFYAGKSDDTIVFGEYDAAGNPIGSTSTPTLPGEQCHASGLVVDDKGLLSTWWCAKDTQCGPCPAGNQFFHLARVKPGAAAPQWTQDYGPIDTSGPVQELAPQLALSPMTGNVVIAGIFNAPTLTVTGGTVLVSPDPGKPKGFVASFGALP